MTFHPQPIVIPRTRLIFLGNTDTTAHGPGKTHNILSNQEQLFMSSDFHSQDLITRQMLDAAVSRMRRAQWSYPSLTEEVILEAKGPENL